MPSGGGGSGETWEEINAITLSDAVNTVTINTDSGGNAIALKKVRILIEGSATKHQDLFFNNSRYIRGSFAGRTFLREDVLLHCGQKYRELPSRESGCKYLFWRNYNYRDKTHC